MTFIKTLFIVAALSIAAAAHAQIPVQMESFSVNDVTLTQSDFKHAEDMFSHMMKEWEDEKQ